jgi:hypothetical protein
MSLNIEIVLQANCPDVSNADAVKVIKRQIMDKYPMDRVAGQLATVPCNVGIHFL